MLSLSDLFTETCFAKLCTEVFSARYESRDMHRRAWGLEVIEPRESEEPGSLVQIGESRRVRGFSKNECGSISQTGATVPPAAPPVPTRDRVTVQKPLFVESEVARVECHESRRTLTQVQRG